MKTVKVINGFLMLPVEEAGKVMPCTRVNYITAFTTDTDELILAVGDTDTIGMYIVMHPSHARDLAASIMNTQPQTIPDGCLIN